MLDFSFEQKQVQETGNTIIGIDEVGRGPLAGPVVVGAVRFPEDHTPIAGINDSKELSAAARQSLAKQIHTQALACSLGVGTVVQINQNGIVLALVSAIDQALASILAPNDVETSVIIDGRQPKAATPAYSGPIAYVVKGDATIYSVAAASIIAKVYRDNLMIKLDREYPDYDWKQNVGYGTKKHRQAILKHGLCEHHRVGFCQNLLTQ